MDLTMEWIVGNRISFEQFRTAAMQDDLKAFSRLFLNFAVFGICPFTLVMLIWSFFSVGANAFNVWITAFVALIYAGLIYVRFTSVKRDYKRTQKLTAKIAKYRFSQHGFSALAGDGSVLSETMYAHVYKALSVKGVLILYIVKRGMCAFAQDQFEKGEPEQLLGHILEMMPK